MILQTKEDKFPAKHKGITLLLVILVLAALLSISTGITNVVIAELRISGEIVDSFVALYAADEVVEIALFADRDINPLCFPTPGAGANCHDTGWVNIGNGSCARLRVSKIEISPTIHDVELRATGEYPCGGGSFAVKRALHTSYRFTQ